MTPKIGRNDPCPCASGKKYKLCCQSSEHTAPAPQPPSETDVSASLQTALALHQAGHLGHAEAIYTQIIQNRPRHPDALHYLGMLASQTDRGEMAVTLIRKAIHIAPSHLMHFNLATELRRQTRFEEAAESFRNALALKADFFEAYYSLGQLLQEMGEHAEAEACIRKAAGLRPEYADVYVALASIHNDLGNFDASRSALASALSIQPQHPAAWAMLSQTRKMTLKDQAWLYTALSLIETQTLSLDQQTELLFAVGKYYDDTRQFDLAFPAYQQANELKKKIDGSFNRARFTQFIDAIINAYGAPEHMQDREGASQSERPVFIVGMPRSGTSLIEQIIASHPAAYGAGELEFWSQYGLSNEYTTLKDLNKTQIAKLAQAYEQLIRQCDPLAARVIDKMPSNFCWVGLIKTVFPLAKFIHAQRNPADICLSIYFQNFKFRHPYAADLNDLAYYYGEYSRLMTHWKSVLPPDSLLAVPYEELVGAPNTWIPKIIEFIDLDWDERCLNFHRTERKVATLSNWSVRQKLYLNSKQRWRNYQSHITPLLGLLNSDQSGK